jgi:hypothetical protein
VIAATNYMEKIPSTFMREGRFESMIDSERSMSSLTKHLVSEFERTLIENHVLPEDTRLSIETVRRVISTKTSAEISALTNVIRSLLARGSRHAIHRVLESL